MESATPAPAPSPGRRSSVAELSHDFRIANGRLARRLRQEKADNELSGGQFSALGSLFLDGPLTLGELSDLEHVTPPSMNRTVNCLVEAGLVQRAGADDDGRKVMLSATEQGQALMRETRMRRDAWLAKRVSGLTPEQRRVLAEATLIMRGLADS
ncbi:MarR family winged helix-turn-helix transcriptional regulator [Cryobacterium tagatosivorans]|uniref:MarR family transcriptional regulator n=1 Tax=Cryobacterium tagatosivorans TaxID=1259199 RepID=A0A4R8UEC9_9MICO|nr:MarR family transcriptional regulator [Cryobacterium tagatosivorans]TFB49951.1 MarR family transcriptional regulator [Cryobacterium tagatosivorans]